MRYITFTGLILISLLTAGCANASSASTDSYYDEVDEQTQAFYQENEVLYDDIQGIQEERYLLYVHSPDCKFCIQFAPEIQAYQSSSDAYPIYKLHARIPENEAAWEDFAIEGVPTVLLMEGTDVIDRIVGYVPEGNLFRP